MLKSLNISNLAVIRELSVQFREGLNLLTGETGAGKSIIIDALNLLGGERATSELIRTDERRAVIEGAFASDNAKTVRRILDESGIEGEDGEVIIRRELSESGRSRAFINDQLTTLAVVKTLAPHLFEIHGQGEQYALTAANTQLELLDDFAGASRREVAEAYLETKTARRKLEEYGRSHAERVRMSDYLAYQLKEIERIAPRPGEDEELEAERKLLAHAEKLLASSAEAFAELYESDQSVLSRLSLVRKRIQESSALDKRIGQTLDAVETASALLADAAENLRGYGADIDFSKERIEEVEDRLAELEGLKRKYGKSLHEICELKVSIAGQLSEVDTAAEREQCLRSELASSEARYSASASALSAMRRAAARELERRVMSELPELAMERARFSVSFARAAASEAQFSEWTPHGYDRIEFLFSANEGETARPLARVASGGELSRLMLTLRAVCQSESGAGRGGTLIFDEIDAGVSGRVAEAVGRRLHGLARGRQILCVTHQPQIARFADHHLRITKSVRHKRTVTAIEVLDGEGRIGELARLIGGAETVETAREAARWLLETATQERQTRATKSQMRRQTP